MRKRWLAWIGLGVMMAAAGILITVFMVFGTRDQYGARYVLSSDRAAQYQSVKTLKVCTTGDYPPLTFYSVSQDEFKGFAIMVITAFAQSIHRPVVFMQTTWSNMNHDLTQQCDIAMGGITRTVNRGYLFNLSANILADRKAPIFSKYNDNRFKTYQDVDKEGNIVIENKGGTNEVFARSHIKHATIKIVRSNAAAYHYLQVNLDKPIVMFTDSIEIQYRTHLKHNSLSNNGLEFRNIPNNPITHKVYMTNKDSAGTQLIKEMNNFYKTHEKQFKDWYQLSLKQQYDQALV